MASTSGTLRHRGGGGGDSGTASVTAVSAAAAPDGGSSVVESATTGEGGDLASPQATPVPPPSMITANVPPQVDSTGTCTAWVSSPWVKASIVLNLVLVLALLQVHMTRYSVGDVINKLEDVLDDELAKEYITPQQYAATIDSFIRRLRVDIPPHAEGTPLTELYKRFLEENNLQDELPNVPAAAWAPVPPQPGSTGEDVETLEFTITAHEQQWPVTLLATDDPTSATERVCTTLALTLTTCVNLQPMVEQQLAAKGAPPPSMEHWADHFAVYIASPRSEQVVHFTDAIPIDLRVGNSVIRGGQVSVRTCLFLDQRRRGRGDALWCGAVPTTTGLQLPPAFLGEGTHLLKVQRTDSLTDGRRPHTVLIRVTGPAAAIASVALDSVVANVTDSGQGAAAVCALLDGGAAVTRITCAPASAIPQWDGKRGVTHQVPIALEPALANGAYNVSVILVSPRRQVLVRTQPVSFVVQSSPHGEAPPQPMQWLSTVRDFDFGMGSPNGEQGLLEMLFKHLGTAQGPGAYGGTAVEMFTPQLDTTCTLFLGQVLGWHIANVDPFHPDPSVHRGAPTVETITATVQAAARRAVGASSDAGSGPTPALDLLVMRTGFNGFWLWDALDTSATGVQPRVVVMEVNANIPPEELRAVKYDARREWDGYSDYTGGSVGALATSAARKGYVMVYCENHGEHCFFVRGDLLTRGDGGTAVPSVATVGADKGAQATQERVEALRQLLATSLTIKSVAVPANYYGMGRGYEAGEGVWVDVERQQQQQQAQQ